MRCIWVLPQIVADQDVTGINVELKESATMKQAPNLDGLFGGSGASQ